MRFIWVIPLSLVFTWLYNRSQRSLLLLSAVLAVGSVVGTMLAWWGHFWSTGRRIQYTLVALAVLAWTWELFYWNLLGFRA